MIKALILGATGMLGFALHRVMHDRGIEVVGTVRGTAAPQSPWCRGLNYALDVDVEDLPGVIRTIECVRADVVINAVGLSSATCGTDLRTLFAVNAVFPRLLATATEAMGVYFIHFSSDGVFSGSSGMYREQTMPDAQDVYGMSKFLGEPTARNALVLRTSMLGRGIRGNRSLVDWFLAQTGSVRGFRRVIFSGLPVNEIAELLVKKLLSRSEPLIGLYHLSTVPISKYELLHLIQAAWSRERVRIEPDDSVTLDRSLDSSRLQSALGYALPPWQDMITAMHSFYLSLDRSPAGRAEVS